MHIQAIYLYHRMSIISFQQEISKVIIDSCFTLMQLLQNHSNFAKQKEKEKQTPRTNQISTNFSHRDNEKVNPQGTHKIKTEKKIVV